MHQLLGKNGLGACCHVAKLISFSVFSGGFQGSNMRMGSVHRAADTLPGHILLYLRKNYFCVIKDKTSSYISSNYGRSLLILEKTRAFIISPLEMKVRVNYL